MPTASSKTANSGPPINMPDLLHEPIKNMVCVLDKKLRNLEKRKLKLVETKKKAEDGSELNEDQKKALENLILVDNSLATVKEVHKTLGSVEQEYLKLYRKDQKRVKQEQKEQFETKSQETVCRTIQIQAILGELNEDVRPDFLNGTNGACELTEDELANLDSYYELINVTSESKKTNFSSRVTEVAMHIFCLIEAKDKLAFENVTYKELNKVLTRIQDCGYFDKAEEVIEEEPEVVEDDKEEEEEEFASVEGEEEEVPVETESNDMYTDVSPREDLSSTEIEPISEPYLEQPIVEEIQLEILDAPTIPIEETNGVDLPPEVQQTQQTPDNEKIDFMGESEISPAMLESQQQSLNPVSPEFIPRNMQPVEDNGWSETPSAPSTASTNDSGWTETPSGDNEWHAVPDFNQNNGGGFRGRGRGGGGRGFNARGRGGRGGSGGSGGGFRGGRQEGNNYRDGGNYRGGNRGGRGGRGGDGVRGGPRGRRGGDNYRGGDRGGRGGFGGGFNNRSAPQ